MSDVSSRANDSNGYLARDDRRISVQGDNNDERMSTLLSELIQLMERKVDTDEEGLRYLKLVVEDRYNRRDRYERPSSYHSDLDNCHEDYEGRRYSGRYD
ncbi:hypothetical protein SEUCBS139899_007021 [Sporothrix eucalyptigena]